ncbi:hypothetical protein SDC9_83425 [bioreactor metagenome]|uniref:Uncharacterized protein n=1 Tax=bioreactor metagenome TaxID=1076179 RepID=A0A644Z7P4_9ZZZZ
MIEPGRGVVQHAESHDRHVHRLVEGRLNDRRVPGGIGSIEVQPSHRGRAGFPDGFDGCFPMPGAGTAGQHDICRLVGHQFADDCQAELAGPAEQQDSHRFRPQKRRPTT